ncbi:putative methyltransferase domain protein [Acinetobacter baumannii 24812_8]|nr:putative methyltransferase domain protein [Acinetobacter baumannii 24812_8]
MNNEKSITHYWGRMEKTGDRDLSQLHLPATWQQVKTTKAVHAGLYQKVSDSLKLPFSLQSFKLTQTNHCNKCCTGTYNFFAIWLNTAPSASPPQ